mgnify:CR=1 FL=1|tara:strand:+ start:516 stop:1013 length:498 start_codon:yes stop_codon:yes gene_type:complete
MSSIDGKISCDRCGEYNHERSMVFHGTTAMCIGCDDEVEELEEMCWFGGLCIGDDEIEELDSSEDIFFPCDECGTMTAEHMLAKVPTNAGTLNCCPMCYSECYEDPRGVSTEYTINYLEVIKHEVRVTAMSRAQAERITLSGNKAFALRKTRLPQTIGKSIVKET